MKAKMLLSVLVVAALLGGLVSALPASLTVNTDKGTYAAGESVNVAVTGGVAGNIIMLQVNFGGTPVWAAQDVFAAGGTFAYTLKLTSDQSAGTYTIIAKDSATGATGTKTFEVSGAPPSPTNKSPIASITAPSEAIEKDSVSFSGSGTDPDGTVVGYFWDFGDGSTGLGDMASHTYTTPGTYTVTLTVTDNLGASGTATHSIIIKANQPPTASISGPSDGKINVAVSFSGSGTDPDGTIASYAWAFGDGNTATGSSVTHTYTVAGTYTVTLTVTDNKGKTGSATASIKIYNPSPTVEEIKKDTPTDAAAKLTETLPSDAAAILNELPAQDAAQIVDDMTPDTALTIFGEMAAGDAATIADKMDPENVALMIDTAVPVEKQTEMAGILLAMNDQKAAECLVDAQPANAAVVIESMATENLNEAAKTVEDAVKLFIQELDPAQQKAIKQKVKETLEDCTVESLVNLFLEIANLPATPSTVATVFETIDLSKTLSVITGMGANNGWDELGKVFSYLSQATLDAIYSAMPGAQRASVSPYLTAQTVALLPKIGTYQVSALALTPSTAKPGAAVTVSVKVTNVGLEAGTHDVALKLNGAVSQTKTVALNAGQSTDVSFALTAGAAGTYTVAVETQSASLTVSAGAANIAVTSLTLSKTAALIGEQLTATIVVSNTGDAAGDYALVVTLDGVQKYSESVTVAAGGTATKTYTVSGDAAGSHTVAAGGQSAQFTVSEPPKPFPWEWVIGGVAVVAIVVVYFLLTRRK